MRAAVRHVLESPKTVVGIRDSILFRVELRRTEAGYFTDTQLVLRRGYWLIWGPSWIEQRFISVLGTMQMKYCIDRAVGMDTKRDKSLHDVTSGHTGSSPQEDLLRV